MPRSAEKSKKSASGLGNIRKKTVTRNGQQYTYWEARYTEGYDPGTGKQIQRSISGKTQKEPEYESIMSDLYKVRFPEDCASPRPLV